MHEVKADMKKEPAITAASSSQCQPLVKLTTRFVVVVTLEALISRFRLADQRVAIGSPVKTAQPSKAGAVVAVEFRMFIPIDWVHALHADKSQTLP